MAIQRPAIERSQTDWLFGRRPGQVRRPTAWAGPCQSWHVCGGAGDPVRHAGQEIRVGSREANRQTPTARKRDCRSREGEAGRKGKHYASPVVWPAVARTSTILLPRTRYWRRTSGPYEHANFYMSYKGLLVVQFVHAIRNSSQAGWPIAEEARSSGARIGLDSFAGCTRGAACFGSELFAPQEARHHRPG